MKGMTKAQCLIFERAAEAVLREAIGDPEGEHTEGNPFWEWEYREGVTARAILFCDSKRAGRTYRSSWLACRVSSLSFVGSDGYTLPRADIPGGWPAHCTYPSGKHNLLANWEIDTSNPEAARRGVLAHLLQLAERGTETHDSFCRVEFEPAV